MKNYFTREKDFTPNTNVPRNAELIGRISYASGEICIDFYCVRYEPAHPEYGHWALWKVCDWTGSKPQPTCLDEMIRLRVIHKDVKVEDGISHN